MIAGNEPRPAPALAEASGEKLIPARAQASIWPEALPAHAEGERELRAITHDLWQHAEKLAKAEVQLGLAEIERNLHEAKLALVQSVISGALFYAAYLTLLAALVLGLSNFVAPWLSALIVAICAGAGGYLFMQRTKRAARAALTPPRPDKYSLQASPHRVELERSES